MIVCGVDLSGLAAAPAIAVTAASPPVSAAASLIVHAVIGPGDPADRLAALRDEAGAVDAEVRLLPRARPAETLMAAAAAEDAALPSSWARRGTRRCARCSAA